MTKIRRYQNATAPFSINQLENFFILVGQIKKHGLTIDEAVEIFNEEKKLGIAQSILAQKEFLKSHVDKRVMPICPECGQQLIKVPVNTRPGDQVGGDYKAMLSCTNIISCAYTKLLKN